jgi:hypothetical protein
VGALTIYTTSGGEISVEQRVIIQAIAPLLASALSVAIAHDDVAAIDGTDLKSREALYTVVDAILSSRSRRSERNDAERIAVVRVTWRIGDREGIESEYMRATIGKAIASATRSSGYVIRLAVDNLVLVAPQKLLWAAGLTPSSPTAPTRNTELIHGSHKFGETQGSTAKPLIH